MAKLDKRKFTKQQWHIIREQRRFEKLQKKHKKLVQTDTTKINNDIAFVLGNGLSRQGIDVNELSRIGKIYGCNALYRTFAADYLVAVDVKMVLEINKSGYQKKNQVWTNPNRAYDRMQGLNFFTPSKGWSSGPTALWLASQHGYQKIFILGFDFRGLKEGTKFNNVYADTPNYKKSEDGATFFGNWLRQTKQVIKENPNINYIRVKLADNYEPEELNIFENYRAITVDQFKKQHNLT